jgi:hypothetical protein
MSDIKGLLVEGVYNPLIVSIYDPEKNVHFEKVGVIAQTSISSRG